MAEAKGQRTEEQDPSMEEILQSIRRIIAEDDKGDAAATGGDAALPAGEGKNLSSDVLELTEMVQDDGSTVSLPASADSNPTDILASIDNALGDKKPKKETPPPAPAAAAAPAEPVGPPPPPAPPAAPVAAAAPMVDENSLLSERAANEAAASLQKLTKRPAKAPASRTPSMSFKSGDTVEDLAMAALMPMLKEWLDNNMPEIVERIVEREVKKLSGS